jgi:hypothetical protein
MRIISKFVDFYDAVQAMGIDKELIYLREESEIKLQSSKDETKNSDLIIKINKEFENIFNAVRPLSRYNNIASLRTNTIGGVDYNLQLIIIVFCGKVYPAVRVDIFSKSQKVLFNFQEIEEYLLKNKLVIKESRRWNSGSTEKILGEIFKFQGKEINYSWFFNIKAPVFVLDGQKFIINPNLKKYNFVKVKDPYTAFQEIAMFLGGVLGFKAPATINISDKDMMFKKGFDNTSFKTISPGKKFNRRGNKCIS